MSNPMRKKAKSIGPRDTYVIDDVWSIIKQFVIDYAYIHRTKMISVLSELRHSFALLRREYWLGIDGSLLCVRHHQYTIINSNGH